MEAATALMQAGQAQAQAQQAQQSQGQQQQQESKKDDDVVDAEFEDVTDNKK